MQFLNPGIISKQADVLVVVLGFFLGVVTAGGGGAVAAKSFSIFLISTRTASSSGSGMRIVRSSLRNDAASESPVFNWSFSSHSSVGSEFEYSTMRMEGGVVSSGDGFLAIRWGFWGRPEESIYVGCFWGSWCNGSLRMEEESLVGFRGWAQGRKRLVSQLIFGEI